MRTISRTRDESGVALITALLAMLLISGLMAGMFAALTADQRSHAVDRDQSQAYAAAHAGLEKLTTGLAQLFVTDVSPSATQISAVDDLAPDLAGFKYKAPGGADGTGYAITFETITIAGPDFGNPKPSASNDITTGPFAGFKGVITPYTLTVTAVSNGGSEVRLRREMQTVAVPVFQFGIFGEKSLSYFAGSPFTFGGRVHTNEHLFLAAGSSTSVTFTDKLTAVGQVVRAFLQNGATLAASGAAGTVTIPKVIGVSSGNLTANQGSTSASVGLGNGGPNDPPWTGWDNLSKVTYNTNIRTTATGAKRLDLPLVSQGATPIDLIRRPAVGSDEDTSNKPVFGQRYFSQASLRILLSDRLADLEDLPTVTDGAIALDGSWNPGGGLPPVARSIGPNSANISSTGGTGSSSTGTITITGGVPNWLRMGGVALASFSLTISSSTVTGCTAMTATTLTGCTVGGATVPANTNFNYTLPSGEVIGLRTGVASSPSGTGGSKTVTLVSTRDLAIGARLIWSAAGNALTCSGHTATVLNGCYWTTAPATSVSTFSLSNAGQSLLGGFIKIERQGPVGTWTDVTAEILGLGFSAPNQEGTSTTCNDPTPDAVIRLQRLRDNGTPTTACGGGLYSATRLATDYWPNTLYDAREGAFRDVATTEAMRMAGVMQYISLDVANLKRWLAGAIPAVGPTGTQTLNQNGYIVYFSDRRGDHNESDGDVETGEFGFEDLINPAASAWAKSNALEAGEDVNARPEDENYMPTLEIYGETPHALAMPTGALAPNGTSATNVRPLTFLTAHPQARVNRVVLFRRALKLINGGIVGGVNRLPDDGLTVASENAIYVQGNYNATTSVTANPHVPASVIGDAVSLLSNNWLDARSLGTAANDVQGRPATTTGYRFAMVSGRGVPFLRPTAWTAQALWGTDGGVHNFMRMLEDWQPAAGFQDTNYRGSMVGLYNSRQLTGTFKLNNNVFVQGNRNFNFDVDFLDPALLPPGTPMFRDINTLRFRQILRPNQ